MTSLDPDKHAVYHAEALVFEGTLYDEIVPDSAIESLAEELFGSDWWQSQGIATPKLSLRRLEAQASHALTWHPIIKREPEIRFSVQQVNAWTLAHEAAHIANDHLFDAYTNTSVTSHGAEFRAVYAAVAEILLGKEAADGLAASFTRIMGPQPTLLPRLSDAGTADGIYHRWRSIRNLEEMRKLTKDHVPSVSRVNGAIAL